MFHRCAITAVSVDYTHIEAIGNSTCNERKTFVAVYSPPTPVLIPDDFTQLLEKSHTLVGGDWNAQHQSPSQNYQQHSAYFRIRPGEGMSQTFVTNWMPSYFRSQQYVCSILTTIPCCSLSQKITALLLLQSSLPG